MNTLKKHLLLIIMSTIILVIPVIPVKASGRAAADSSHEDILSCITGITFYFRSGAGAWWTEVTMKENGSFAGIYTDADMGDNGEGYPNGTRYESMFEGRFVVKDKIDDYTYSLELKDFQVKGRVGEEEIVDGVKIITADAPSDKSQYLQIYQSFLKAEEWTKEEDAQDLPLTGYSIFDLDGNGIPELWLEAYDETGVRARGISVLYTIEDGQVKKLLLGYLTGGSIGGDFISFYTDNETSQPVVALAGYAGGFGGNAGWSEYYGYENGVLSSRSKTYTVSLIESNYSKEELKDPSLYSLEPDGTYITTYKIDDVQCTKEAYDLAEDRFTQVYYFNALSRINQLMRCLEQIGKDGAI